MQENIQNHQVYAPNKCVLRNKLVKTLQEGKEKFKIVTDFDATLSSPKGFSSWGVVEHNPDFSQNYRDNCKKLFQKYHPLEISPTLSHDEKCDAMLEWWNHAQGALVEEKISREKYEALLRRAQETIFLRDGCNELFALSSKLHVPCLIFSAGIGDVIDSIMLHHFSHHYQPINPYYPMAKFPTVYYLQQLEKTKKESHVVGNTQIDISISDANDVASPTTQEVLAKHNPGTIPGIPRTIFIIANHFDFHSSTDGANTVKRFDISTHLPTDLICGFYTNESIHVFNKHEELVKKADYYPNQIQPRTNVVLLGDSLGDALMVAKDSPDNVIRIGFLNTSASKTVDSHLDAYLDKFDIVFVDSDNGINFCNKILEYFTAINSQQNSVDIAIEKFVDECLKNVTEKKN